MTAVEVLLAAGRSMSNRSRSPGMDRRLRHLPPPPMAPPKSCAQAGAGFSWSSRMSSHRDGVFCKLGEALDLLRPEAGDALGNLAAHSATSRNVNKSKTSSPSHASGAPFTVFASASESACKDPLLASIVTLFQLLDKDWVHELDSATVLKFLEVLGWGPQDPAEKYLEWELDWQDICCWLGREKTPVLRIVDFEQFLRRPGGPPLFAAWSVSQMLHFVEQSWLGQRILMPPPTYACPEAAGKLAAKKIEGLSQWEIEDYISRMQELEPRLGDFVLPTGAFYVWWEYKIFGKTLMHWHDERRTQKIPVGAKISPGARTQTSLPAAPKPQPQPYRVFQRVPVCWLIYKDEQYLHVNGYGLVTDILKESVWRTQKHVAGATRAAFDVVDGCSVEGFPEDVMKGEFAGMKCMFSASNKKARTQGMWLALCVHFLLNSGQKRQLPAESQFDSEVCRLVDLLKDSQETVDFEKNVAVSSRTSSS